MEHTSESVAEGKLIGETTYLDRSRKFTELELDGVKIDFYDPRHRVVHEVKRSPAMEEAHIAQVKYYLFKLYQAGVEDASAILEYPKLKQRLEVSALTETDRNDIVVWCAQVEQIANLPTCPDLLHGQICKRCSYYDFCYVSEPEVA